MSAKLEKMTIVQEKKEKIIAEKSEQVKEVRVDKVITFTSMKF